MSNSWNKVLQGVASFFGFVLFFGATVGSCIGCGFLVDKITSPPQGSVLTTVIEQHDSFQLNGKKCGSYYICHCWMFNGQKVETADCNQRFVKCEDETVTKVEVNQGKQGWQ